MEVKRIKRVKEKPKPLYFPYLFERSANNGTMAAAVKELIKHLLFMTEQIPMPVDLLKCTYKPTGEMQQIGKKRASNLRKLKFVENLTNVLDTLVKCFNLYKVQKVVLLLGSTVVSPKLTYLILCRTTEHFNNSAVDNGIVRKLLRTVVTSDQISGHTRGLPIQNIHILISFKEAYYVSEETGGVFSPKANFLLPRNGRTHVFDFNCNEDLSRNVELDFREITPDKQNEEMCVTIDYWYGVTLPLKGFKEGVR